jgi:hypothetical protein
MLGYQGFFGINNLFLARGEKVCFIIPFGASKIVDPPP